MIKIKVFLKILQTQMVSKILKLLYYIRKQRSEWQRYLLGGHNISGLRLFQKRFSFATKLFGRFQIGSERFDSLESLLQNLETFRRRNCYFLDSRSNGSRGDTSVG